MNNGKFIVQFKGQNGWEPLGVMTMAEAFAWAFAHGHALLDFEPEDSRNAKRH